MPQEFGAGAGLSKYDIAYFSDNTGGELSASLFLASAVRFFPLAASMPHRLVASNAVRASVLSFEMVICVFMNNLPSTLSELPPTPKASSFAEAMADRASDKLYYCCRFILCIKIILRSFTVLIFYSHISSLFL